MYYSTRRQCVVCLSLLVALAEGNLLEWEQLFLREILWWVGNFPGGGRGGLFSSGAMVQETIFLWGNWPGGNIQGATVQGQLTGGQFSPVAIFWTPNEIFSFCKTLTKIIAKLGIDVKQFCHWKMQMFLNSYFCYLISLSSSLLFLSCLS